MSTKRKNEPTSAKTQKVIKMTIRDEPPAKKGKTTETVS